MRLKKTFSVIIILFVGLFCSNAYADSFIIKINLTEGEHSKDNWSSETSISIDGSMFLYAKSYSGSAKGHSKDIAKNCTLTDDQVTQIQTLLKDKNLLKSDSLFDKDEKYKSFERFVNISMKISVWETLSKISVNGDANSLKDAELYKNCYALINLLNDIADQCN
jgi:hypothetical protein